jgi:hypothetical protein
VEALEAVLGVLVLLGVLLALLITPILLVWPRAWSRLVPSRWRGAFVRRPGRLTTIVTILLAIWSGASMSPLVLSAGEPGRSASQRATAALLVWLIFAGLTGAAVARTLRIGIAEWAVLAQGAPSAPPSRWQVSQTSPGVAPLRMAPDYFADARPAEHRRDRELRNAGRWLAAVGLTWYLLGRVAQAASQRTEAPDWWWWGTLVLAAVGASVWIARRHRWRGQGRRSSLTGLGLTFDEVLTGYGLAVRRPAGPWVESWAPSAFLPASAITGPALWPWMANGSLQGFPVLVAAQQGQLRNATGLTAPRVRIACVVKLTGIRLPHVTVAERSAVPPQHRHSSIQLESDSFNRSMWVYGETARGAYDVIHPRAMAHAMRELPDGASVILEGDTISVITDEPMSPAQLGQMITFAVRLAELTPNYLREIPPQAPVS